jgi:hypothetical protein
MAILGYKNNNRAHQTRAFGMAEWLETRGLAGWLEIATDSLEEPAQQRIANEIGAHYAEAVSAHITAGAPGQSAQASALAELGDPVAAALNFKKSHLSEVQAKSIKWMERAAVNPLFSVRALPFESIPVAAVALSFYSWHWDFRPFLGNHFLAGLLLVAYAGFRLIPRLLCARSLPRNSFLRGLALSYLITGVALTLPFALIIYMQDPGASGAFDASFICLLYGHSLNPGFQIWKKLRKMGHEWQDNPVPPTTAT